MMTVIKETVHITTISVIKCVVVNYIILKVSEMYWYNH